MSFLPLDQMAYKDSAQLDAFNNLRVSTGTTLGGVTQEYTSQPLVMENFTASTGTAVHSTSTNSTVLSTVGATSGARALRQKKVYLRYNPGKSQLIKMTGTLRKGGVPSGAAFAGIGYYDDDNGVFFRDTSAGVAVVVRSNTSGSPVDDAVLQANWNVDKMDGTGPSGITINWTKEQIFMFDLQWLGVGRVRYYLVVNGRSYIVHDFMHANLTTVAYTRTACLPPRYEVFNKGGAGSAISVEAICWSVESEGGLSEDQFYNFSYSAYIATPMSLDTTMRPVVTRRLRDTFGGMTVRGHAHLSSFQLLVATNPIYWEIRLNQAITVPGTTVNNLVDSTYSISEYDTYTGAANTVSGGILLANGFAVPGTGVNRGTASVSDIGSAPLLGRTYSNVRDTYTLSARSTTGAATVSLAAELQEQY